MLRWLGSVFIFIHLVYWCCYRRRSEEEGGNVRDHEEAGDQWCGEEPSASEHQGLQIRIQPGQLEHESLEQYKLAQCKLNILYISAVSKYSFICVFELSFIYLIFEQNSGIWKVTQNLISIEVSQLQYWPPPPWIWAWPTQCPDTLWAELQMWRIHNLNQPGPWWWKWDQLFCWNLIKPTHLCFPTMPENSMSLLATSWGCSIKFVVESMTPKVEI